MIRYSLLSSLLFLASPAMAQPHAGFADAMAELSETASIRCEALDRMTSHVDLQSFANGSKPRIETPTALADLYTVVTAPMCAAATAYDDDWSVSITPLMLEGATAILFEEQALDGSYHQQSVLMFDHEHGDWTAAVDLCATTDRESVSFCAP